jgi:hypothetical protein
MDTGLWLVSAEDRLRAGTSRTATVRLGPAAA